MTVGLREQRLNMNAVCKLLAEGLREHVLKTNIKWPGILKSSPLGALCSEWRIPVPVFTRYLNFLLWVLYCLFS